MNVQFSVIAIRTISLMMACVFLTTVSSLAVAQSKSVKVGFVTFLSGAAAVPFGIPARNAARIVVEAINAGTLPAPYNHSGLAGSLIQPVFVDENSKQKVKDYQQLVRQGGVELVVGYISSGSCKAIAPVAEKEKRLTVLFDCGTPQIFEEINPDPRYVFRTASHATMDNVAAAKYVLDTNPAIATVSGINQDYAWGQGSWRDFSASIAVMQNAVQVSSEQFPKLFAGQYKSELRQVLNDKPDIVHSSFWGSDVEALVIQGAVKNVFNQSQLILTAGDTAMHRLGPQIPNGTIIGARGANGQLAPNNVLNDWFRKAYFQRFGSFPTYPAYHMAQAILGVKAAADKIGSVKQDAVRSSLVGLEFIAPSGTVKMALSNGHQAITDTAYGSYQYNAKTGKGKLVNIKRYRASCVNPPAGVTSIDWIKSGFKGANCS